jgi:hypothetical protein
MAFAFWEGAFEGIRGSTAGGFSQPDRSSLKPFVAGRVSSASVCVGTKKKPQISPLRFAPVEMTNLSSYARPYIDWKTAVYPKQICHLDWSEA